jgi:copper chaperone NosL
MRWLIVAVGVLAVGCSTVKPLPVIVGDRCFRCQRPIDDLKLAAQAIDEGGHAMKFRTAGCMAKYMADHQGDTYKAMFVTDYSSGKFILADRATFAKVTVNPASLEKDYAAFGSAQTAADLAKKESSATLDWTGVLAAAATP